MHHAPGQHGCRGGSVAGYVVGLFGYFFDQFGANALVWVFEVDFFGDRNTVIGDRWSAPLFVEHDVATFWSEGDTNSVSQFIHPVFEGSASYFVKCDDLGHVISFRKTYVDKR